MHYTRIINNNSVVVISSYLALRTRNNIALKRIASPFLQIIVSKEYLHLEPIGLVFVFFFAFIIVIQFTAMLFHRFGTLSHILASTDLNLCCNKKVSAYDGTTAGWVGQRVKVESAFSRETLRFPIHRYSAHKIYIKCNNIVFRVDRLKT